MRKRVMFLCTGNSARSQMAEGLARHMAGQEWEVFSAGLDPQGLNPYAVKAMSEIGIDISGQRSKAIDLNLLQTMDVIVTLCGDAEERCPVTPAGVLHLYWPLPDPAKVSGTDEEILAEFRRIRDEIRDRIAYLIGELGREQSIPRG
ncbi:MAG TPA: arsenate reductase (thioredoxin) [Firmicutes bacterium]|nr:arsenate reductase (thioredoxin) [Candidatus Fermentithermobacillaceae bacterium]